MANIGIDIDEVLSETARSYLTFHNKKYDTNYTFNHLSDYSFGEVLGVSREDKKRNILDFFRSNYPVNASPVHGSIEAITKLSTKNQLFAVTSRPKQLEQITMLWLNKYYQDALREVIFTGSDFYSSTTKAAVCQNKRLDYIIEDQLKFAEDCAKVCPTVFLLDKPWNHTKTNEPNIRRVFSWEEIVSIIEA